MTTLTTPLLDCLVTDAAQVADGVIQLTLQAVINRPLPAWRPGAHIDLLLPIGVQRHYSLCGDPADRRRWRIAVLRHPGGRGGSDYIHAALRPGAELSVRGPRNRFALEPAGDYKFVAGGIGITPLLPMVRHLAQADCSSWSMIYGGRSRRSMAFTEELNALGGRVAFCPADEGGRPDLDAYLAGTARGTLVYCCGPEPLMAAVRDLCAALGVGFRCERFAPAAEDEKPNQPFTVTLGQTGDRVRVPADLTTLQALRKAGAVVLSSCEEGMCGTCETPVLAGAVDHRDSILTAEERAANDLMYVCVSRAHGDALVLDL
jgi:ferredoxin-NADP reductase